MNTKYALSLLAACLLLAGCATPPGAPETPMPLVTASAEGDGNEVAVSIEGESVIVDVNSQSGIGSATVELASETIPESIVVRLHLKGLEEFRLSRGRTTITAFVSSGDSQSVTQSVFSPGQDERSIAPGDLFWLEVKIVSDQAAPHIPLDQGHFEIVLPKDFFREGGRSFSFQWIDFYR